ncbi:MAG TPA: tRNA(Ile)(2)-agmatinylcytidine synthase [Methanoregulaceae archaeon]|nr:tRNA(Ile)(2)-agmatinylcytidine synthase [Methanoregulaceae archaeon]
MLVGLDDTDSPGGMCTTYIGVVLAGRLKEYHIPVHEARLLRLNPNVIYKTRGNAAVCLDVTGDREKIFRTACEVVEKYACFDHDNTNPGVVVADSPPSPRFYRQAVQGFCTIDEAKDVLEEAGALYRGYKNERGLIGATAAVCSEIPDRTYEFLTYRKPEAFGTPRNVSRESLFLAERETCPHTWDSVDTTNDVVVCVPHTPDPVLFGIRGESPSWVSKARGLVVSEPTGFEQVFVTNQGTDSHLLDASEVALADGFSYRLQGTVSSVARTGKGGHVCIGIGTDTGAEVDCMAFEPTKGFRNIVRALLPGDVVEVTGSFKNGSLNIEKIHICSLSGAGTTKPPVCGACGKRMTSAGREKGYKCRQCGARAREPEVIPIKRELKTGWYEVPPIARRHLAKPLCRGP